MWNNLSYGMKSLIFSVLGGALVALFYITNFHYYLVRIGVILFIISIPYSVISFRKREKGISKLAPFFVFLLALIAIVLSFIAIAFMGEK